MFSNHFTSDVISMTGCDVINLITDLHCYLSCWTTLVTVHANHLLRVLAVNYIHITWTVVPSTVAIHENNFPVYRFCKCLCTLFILLYMRWRVKFIPLSIFLFLFVVIVLDPCEIILYYPPYLSP